MERPNVADDDGFVLELASLEGRRRDPDQRRLRLSKRRHPTMRDLELRDFEYTSFVLGKVTVGTNAVRDGGDSGHGFETVLILNFDGTGDFHYIVGPGDDARDQEFDSSDGAILTIRAGGCDEALALARLLELAAVALRQQMAANGAKERAQEAADGRSE